MLSSQLDDTQWTCDVAQHDVTSRYVWVWLSLSFAEMLLRRCRSWHCLVLSSTHSCQMFDALRSSLSLSTLRFVTIDNAVHAVLVIWRIDHEFDFAERAISVFFVPGRRCVFGITTQGSFHFGIRFRCSAYWWLCCSEWLWMSRLCRWHGERETWILLIRVWFFPSSFFFLFFSFSLVLFSFVSSFGLALFVLAVVFFFLSFLLFICVSALKRVVVVTGLSCPMSYLCCLVVFCKKQTKDLAVALTKPHV